MSFIISIAMSQRTPSHCSAIEASVSTTASRRAREKAFSCTTSGQAGKYGSRPFASTLPPTRTNEAGSRARSSSLPPTKYSGLCHRPRMVGSDMVRHEVEDEREPTLGQRGPRSRETGRPTQMRDRRSSRGRSTASRPRPRVVEVGQRAPERVGQALVLERDRDPRRAALPDAHQPDGVEPELPDRVPLARRNAREIDRGSVAAAQLVEPHPGVDLVDEGVADQRHSRGRLEESRCVGPSPRPRRAGRARLLLLQRSHVPSPGLDEPGTVVTPRSRVNCEPVSISWRRRMSGRHDGVSCSVPAAAVRNPGQVGSRFIGGGRRGTDGDGGGATGGRPRGVRHHG